MQKYTLDNTLRNLLKEALLNEIGGRPFTKRELIRKGVEGSEMGGLNRNFFNNDPRYYSKSKRNNSSGSGNKNKTASNNQPTTGGVDIQQYINDAQSIEVLKGAKTSIGNNAMLKALYDQKLKQLEKAQNTINNRINTFNSYNFNAIAEDGEITINKYTGKNIENDLEKLKEDTGIDATKYLSDDLRKSLKPSFWARYYKAYSDKGIKGVGIEAFKDMKKNTTFMTVLKYFGIVAGTALSVYLIYSVVNNFIGKKSTFDTYNATMEDNVNMSNDINKKNGRKKNDYFEDTSLVNKLDSIAHNGKISTTLNTSSIVDCGSLLSPEIVKKFIDKKKYTELVKLLEKINRQQNMEKPEWKQKIQKIQNDSNLGLDEKLDTIKITSEILNGNFDKQIITAINNPQAILNNPQYMNALKGKNVAPLLQQMGFDSQIIKEVQKYC